MSALTDDRCGRALDALFEADRATMLTKLMTFVLTEFDIATDELHNDATTLSMQGAYLYRPGGEDKAAPRVCFGHAKERPDLAQLIWFLTVSADGAVPITYRLADGNTAEDPTHIETWEQCRALAGRDDFLYVADAKLCNRPAMTHIDKLGGRFLTVMPRTRSEDGAFRDWVSANEPVLEEVMRRPGKRKDDPDEVYWATPAPTPSSEGFRIVWICSSEKQADDASTRTRRIEKATTAIAGLNRRLGGPKNRLRDRASVQAAGAQEIEDARASRWVSIEVAETTTFTHHQVGRGRPGPNTRYERKEHTIFSVTLHVDDAAVRHDAASDGYWPMMTNDQDMSQADLLAAIKRQPHVERPHHVLKSVIGLVPVYLKSNKRIDAFGFLGYLALLVHALIERDLRRAMARAHMPTISIYPEGRRAKAPTTARVIEVFEPLCAQLLMGDDTALKCFNPALSELQVQILDLLDIPASACRLA